MYRNSVNFMKITTEFTNFGYEFCLVSMPNNNSHLTAFSQNNLGRFKVGFCRFRQVYPKNPPGFFWYVLGYPNPALSADFRGKGRRPPTTVGVKSSRVIALSCGITIHACDEQIDRTTTPKTALAYSCAVKIIKLLLPKIFC